MNRARGRLLPRLARERRGRRLGVVDDDGLVTEVAHEIAQDVREHDLGCGDVYLKRRCGSHSAISGKTSRAISATTCNTMNWNMPA